MKKKLYTTIILIFVALLTLSAQDNTQTKQLTITRQGEFDVENDGYKTSLKNDVAQISLNELFQDRNGVIIPHFFCAVRVHIYALYLTAPHNQL